MGNLFQNVALNELFHIIICFYTYFPKKFKIAGLIPKSLMNYTKNLLRFNRKNGDSFSYLRFETLINILAFALDINVTI